MSSVVVIAYIMKIVQLFQHLLGGWGGGGGKFEISSFGTPLGLFWDCCREACVL